MTDEPTSGDGAVPEASEPSSATRPELTFLEKVTDSERGRPLWTYFLTPVAVVIAGFVVGGAIWLTDDNSNTPATTGTVADPTSSPGVPTIDGGISQVQTLRGMLDAYATAVGLDEEAFNACLVRDGVGLVINDHLTRGSALGVSGTPTFFINNKRVVGAQPAQVFQEIVEKELAGSPTSLDEYSATIQALAASDRFEIMEAAVDVSGAEFEGSPDAGVIIAEFSDFQCPFCQRWNQENLGWLRPMLGDDVALAFLHFPIQQIHPNAPYAAVAAICAGEQGKFWQMHDLLFGRQQEWQSLPVQ